MWYEIFKAVIFRPLVRFVFRARIIGTENVPMTGGALLASNHIAIMDSLVVPAMLPRRVTYPAKAEAFSGKGGPGHALVAWFLKTVGMVPMDRGGGRASAAALHNISAVLAEGALVGIYPEGTRSPDGRLYKGKTGLARMVLGAGVPVLPVGVVGTETVTGPFGMPWIRRPIVVVGKPIHFFELQGRESETKVLRWITDETLAAIQQLTGQEYADVYASRVKHGDLREKGSDDFLLPRPGGGPIPGPPQRRSTT